MTHPANIIRVADASVDATLDLELRGLLSACFTKPQDHVFRQRRHFNEPPAQRWLIRGDDDGLAAHLAVHDKRFEAAGGQTFRFGGVAEVCVHPAYRGKGYVGALLAAAHAWMAAEGFAFSVLSGKPSYYASSGYRTVDNGFRDGVDAAGAPARVRAEGLMALALTDRAWPDGDVFIPGPSF
ncbi:MAG: GNAT family N-acetyltransferase [Verrucomicrobiota bacterium]